MKGAGDAKYGEGRAAIDYDYVEDATGKGNGCRDGLHGKKWRIRTYAVLKHEHGEHLYLSYRVMRHWIS